MPVPSPRGVRGALLAALFLVACAPDYPDAYSVEAPPLTRAPIPTTVAPDSADLDAAESDVGDDGSGSEDVVTASTFAPNGEVVEVRSLDNTFRVADVEVVAGSEVRWVNGGRNEHNVLPVDEIADTAEFGVERDDFTPGDTYSHVFDTPGVYPYYCSIHGTQDAGMIGTVIVTAPS